MSAASSSPALVQWLHSLPRFTFFLQPAGNTFDPHDSVYVHSLLFMALLCVAALIVLEVVLVLCDCCLHMACGNGGQMVCCCMSCQPGEIEEDDDHFEQARPPTRLSNHYRRSKSNRARVMLACAGLLFLLLAGVANFALSARVRVALDPLDEGATWRDGVIGMAEMIGHNISLAEHVIGGDELLEKRAIDKVRHSTGSSDDRLERRGESGRGGERGEREKKERASSEEAGRSSRSERGGIQRHRDIVREGWRKREWMAVRQGGDHFDTAPDDPEAPPDSSTSPEAQHVEASNHLRAARREVASVAHTLSGYDWQHGVRVAHKVDKYRFYAVCALLGLTFLSFLVFIPPLIKPHKHDAARSLSTMCRVGRVILLLTLWTQLSLILAASLALSDFCTDTPGSVKAYTEKEGLNGDIVQYYMTCEPSWEHAPLDERLHSTHAHLSAAATAVSMSQHPELSNDGAPSMVDAAAPIDSALQTLDSLSSSLHCQPYFQRSANQVCSGVLNKAVTLAFLEALAVLSLLHIACCRNVRGVSPETRMGYSVFRRDRARVGRDRDHYHRLPSSTSSSQWDSRANGIEEKLPPILPASNSSSKSSSIFWK